MLEPIIHEMSTALRQEAEAARRQGAVRTNVLRNGRLQRTERAHLYLIDIDRPLSTAVGNDFPGEIEIRGEVFPVTVAESRDTEILLLLPRNLGISIPIA
jgi:hypothetical protein